MVGGRCLVLNASFEFLHVTPSWYDSLRLLRRGKVVAVKNYPTPARAGSQEFPIPAVAVLRQYINTSKKRNHFSQASKRNILIRENFRCAYCDCKLSLGTVTKDHVIPTSRGGSDTLINVVASCKDCNNRKADRTPAEAGMKLSFTPKPLNEEQKMELLVKVHKSSERSLWSECLEELQVKLF